MLKIQGKQIMHILNVFLVSAVKHSQEQSTSRWLMKRSIVHFFAE